MKVAGTMFNAMSKLRQQLAWNSHVRKVDSMHLNAECLACQRKVLYHRQHCSRPIPQTCTLQTQPIDGQHVLQRDKEMVSCSSSCLCDGQHVPVVHYLASCELATVVRMLSVRGYRGKESHRVSHPLTSDRRLSICSLRPPA